MNLNRGACNLYKYDIVPAAIAADRTLNLPLTTQTAAFVVTPSEVDVTFLDCKKVTLGTGGDADVYYNGVDLIIDPGLVADSSVIIGSPADFVGCAADNAKMTQGLTINQGANDDAQEKAGEPAETEQDQMPSDRHGRAAT